MTTRSGQPDLFELYTETGQDRLPRFQTSWSPIPDIECALAMPADIPADVGEVGFGESAGGGLER